MAHPRQDGLLEAVSQVGAVIAALNSPFGDEDYDYHAALVLSLCVRDKINFSKAYKTIAMNADQDTLRGMLPVIQTLEKAAAALEGDRIEMFREDEDPN